MSGRIAGEVMTAVLRVSMGACSPSPQMKGTLFFMSCMSGREIAAKSLIQMRTVPAVLRKPRTSVLVSHGGQLRILETLVPLGIRPLYVQVCSMTMTSEWHAKSFLAETVALACLRQCSTQFTSLQCSQMKRWMLGFLGIVS